jgi:hypothetical protein
MHYGFVDDVNRYAADKALKLLRAGNDTLVVTETAQNVLRLWSDFIANQPSVTNLMVNTLRCRDSGAMLFLRSAQVQSSLRSVCVSGLVLVGNIPTFTKRLAIGRTMGHLSPEMYHFRSIT